MAGLDAVDGFSDRSDISGNLRAALDSEQALAAVEMRMIR
jgi:hypothetical protein